MAKKGSMAGGGEAIRLGDPEAVFGALGKNWGWLLALGVVFLVLGTIGLGMTFALTLASVLFFGILLLIGGGLQIVEAFKCKGWTGIAGHVVIAVLYGIAGIVTIADPVLASTVFTLVLAFAIMAVGIVRIVMAFQHRGVQGWVWALFSGTIAVVLGGMIAIAWPVSGLWVIGLFVAIELILQGWTLIMMALAARNATGA